MVDSNILPVTREDEDAAHAAIYARPDRWSDTPIAPITDDHHGEEWRAALRRALEGDRARVAALEATNA